MTMATMVFHDEVVSPDTIEEIPDDDAKASKREVEMAEQLIDSLSGDFDPTKYKDEYRERVLELIEAKAAGEEIKIQPQEEPAKVPDLMAALEASIASAKSPPKKRARSSNGSGSSKKKKAAAKK